MQRQRARQGGRRFIPGVEALEDRRVPAANFIVMGSTLFVIAPTVPGGGGQRIVITDNGGSGVNNVTAFGVQPFFPNVAISNVAVLTGAGNDRVAYNLVGDLTTARRVDVSLGAGSDQFTATLRRNLLTGSSLTLNVNGGAGDDTLQALIIGSLATNARLSISMIGGAGNNDFAVRTASFVSVAAGASIGIGLFGGGFSDNMVTQYTGLLNGTYQVLAGGGVGPNNILADVELSSGSTGQVLQSQLLGGPSNDVLTFVVHNPGGVRANNQSIDGAGGFDTAFRTTNVVVTNVEQDFVQP